MATADRVIFVAERIISLMVTLIAGSAYVAAGSETERIFYVKLLMFSLWFFTNSTLFSFRENIERYMDNFVEYWWPNKANRSSDGLMFPKSDWNEDEILAFWTERVGMMLHIFFILCFKNHDMDQYHHFVKVITAATLAFPLAFANVLYLLSALERMIDKKKTRKGQELLHKESENCQKGISAMNKLEVVDSKANGLCNESKTPGDKTNLEIQDNLKEEKIFPQEVNEALTEQKTRSNGEREKASTSLKISNNTSHEELNTKSINTDAEEVESMETNNNTDLHMIEEKYEEEFKKREEKWDEILRRVQEKYESDREKWKEEKDLLLQKLAVAKASAQLYCNLLHDLGCN